LLELSPLFFLLPKASNNNNNNSSSSSSSSDSNCNKTCHPCRPPPARPEGRPRPAGWIPACRPDTHTHTHTPHTHMYIIHAQRGGFLVPGRGNHRTYIRDMLHPARTQQCWRFCRLSSSSSSSSSLYKAVCKFDDATP